MSTMQSDKRTTPAHGTETPSPLEALRAPTTALMAGASLALASFPNQGNAVVIPHGMPDAFYLFVGKGYAGPVIAPYGGVVPLEFSYIDPKNSAQRITQRATAVLLDNEHAITPAHLFYNRTDVRASISTRRSYDEPGEKYEASKIFLHPDYAGLQTRTNSPDVAVIRLKTLVRGTQSSRELPIRSTQDKQYTIAGFGPLKTPSGEGQAIPDGAIRAGFADATSMTNSTLSPTFYRAGAFMDVPSGNIRASEEDEGAAVFDGSSRLQGIVVAWDKNNTYFLDISRPSVNSFIEILTRGWERTDPPSLTFTETPTELRLTWPILTDVFNLYSAPSPKGPWAFRDDREITNELFQLRIPKKNTASAEFFRFVYFLDPNP